MKEGKASRTADLAAVFRAAESMRPEDQRVCYDPLAKHFLSGIFSILARSRLLTKVGLWYAERVGPGGVGNKVASTRYIDDYLQTCIDDGIEQLVILGAGYDSRAYRFDELKGKVKVFEVDHSSTQKTKMEKVEKILGSLPDNVVYVPIDFEKQKLDERLFESGYDRNLKTLFIWEAVTCYITAEAVDETLDFVAKNSGEGSSIIFDYIFQSVVDGTCELEGAKEARKEVARRGDPFTFGIEEGTIEEFLSRRGFYQVEIANGEFLKHAYFKGKNQHRKLLHFLEYVQATVKPQKQT
jgi:methyltransferase (TIGR00027 family)